MTVADMRTYSSTLAAVTRETPAEEGEIAVDLSLR